MERNDVLAQCWMLMQTTELMRRTHQLMLDFEIKISHLQLAS